MTGPGLDKHEDPAPSTVFVHVVKKAPLAATESSGSCKEAAEEKESCISLDDIEIDVEPEASSTGIAVHS